MANVAPTPIPGIPGPIKKYREVITDYLYDSTLPGAVTTVTLFQVPIGAAVLLADTNMQQASLIPFSERFMVRGIGGDIIPKARNVLLGADYTSLNNLIDGSWELFINNKSYERGPLASIVYFRVFVEGECAASTSFTFLYAPFFHAKGYWSLPNPFVLTPGTPFRVVINWRNAPGASNPWRLYLYLFGERERTVQ